jgi:hypothetical protein
MSLRVFTIVEDKVIDSLVLTGETTYGFAIDSIYPLINRFSSQRKLQNPSFYERLRKDLLSGCIMPPITLAFVDNTRSAFSNTSEAQDYANHGIASGYVLDGMQRLNTMYSVKDSPDFDRTRTLFFNLIVSPKKDMLLYRMITLNNGQRPMTPRHQIEILTEELFDFTELEIDVQSEKERGERVTRGAFNLSDISKGYLAFFSGTVHIENNKIISEKMDEIIVGKIMESAVIEGPLEFEQVLQLVDRFAADETAKAWLMIQNNLIGFCVGVRDSFEALSPISATEFGELTKQFEEAFKSINASRVNLGRYRRELSKKYISGIATFKSFSDLELLSHFNDLIAQ